MLGTNIHFTSSGKAVVVESWNGRTALKRLVQETVVVLDKRGEVLHPAGSKEK